jgi:hypothetical protein
MIIVNNHKVYGTIQNIFETEVVWVKTIYAIYALNKSEVYPAKTIII